MIKERFRFEYLYPSTKPVVEELKQYEVVYAKDQPQYIPLRSLRSRTDDVRVMSRWALTDEQRKIIADGGDIYLQLSTFGNSLQPIMLAVSTGPNPVYIAHDYRLPLDRLTEDIWTQPAPTPKPKRKSFAQRYEEFGDTFRSVFRRKSV